MPIDQPPPPEGGASSVVAEDHPVPPLPPLGGPGLNFSPELNYVTQHILSHVGAVASAVSGLQQEMLQLRQEQTRAAAPVPPAAAAAAANPDPPPPDAADQLRGAEHFDNSRHSREQEQFLDAPLPYRGPHIPFDAFPPEIARLLEGNQYPLPGALEFATQVHAPYQDYYWQEARKRSNTKWIEEYNVIWTGCHFLSRAIAIDEQLHGPLSGVDGGDYSRRPMAHVKNYLGVLQQRLDVLQRLLDSPAQAHALAARYGIPANMQAHHADSAALIRDIYDLQAREYAKMAAKAEFNKIKSNPRGHPPNNNPGNPPAGRGRGRGRGAGTTPASAPATG